MITISLCMIVKNEERFLKRCLDSVKDLMDEIIIVDTGSTDRTKEIAREYTDKIYDFTWVNDFSAARNFAFQKATCDYIYTADADEIIDEENQQKFLNLKTAMLPEIEIIQFFYDETGAISTVLNENQELRPKLFKRLRSFTWIDPIHETVRLDPVVFDSDIIIQHRPEENHSGRDFHIFENAYEKTGSLSKRIFRMYLQELYRWGTVSQLETAVPIITDLYQDDTELYLMASTLLCRFARLQKDYPSFLKYTSHLLVLTQGTPCSEVCCELALYYEELGDVNEALTWYQNALWETEPLLDIAAGDQIPKEGIERLQ